MGKKKKEKKKKLDNDFTIPTKEDIKPLLASYNDLFNDDKYYNEINTLLENYLKTLRLSTYQNNEEQSYYTIFLTLKMKIIKFICEKIKQGNIALEINFIDQYMKHSNLIYPIIDRLVANNTQKERYEKYINLSLEYENYKKDFIKKLWEDSIIETIENYQENDFFTLEIFRSFKNKIPNIDREFEKFLNNRSKVKTKKLHSKIK
ncbi:MAG: hypothetical protein GX190_01620 [Mollicutes bacterium]|nr:hypothetical protein [Mollicutes bacterium]